MFKKFAEFVCSLNEGNKVTISKGVEYETKSTSEVFDEFKLKKYRFIGKFYWKNKSINAWVNDNIKDVVNNVVHPIDEKVFGKKKNHFHNVDIYYKPSKYFDTYGEKDNIIAKYGETMGNNVIKKRERILKEYMSNLGGEKLIKLKDGGVCFYNPNVETPYYYFFYFTSQSFGYLQDNDSNMDKLFDMWTLLKTNPDALSIIERNYEIQKEQEEEYKRYCEKVRLENEEKDRKRNDVRNIIKKIKNDYSINPKKYKETTWENLPDDIEAQVDEYDELKQYDNDYFKYVYTYETNHFYTVVTVTIINNKDLTDGYIIQTESSTRRYMGD